MNPTGVDYSFRWICEDIPDARIQPSFLCHVKEGKLSSGKKLAVKYFNFFLYLASDTDSLNGQAKSYLRFTRTLSSNGGQSAAREPYVACRSFVCGSSFEL